jgi:hypothetical protein
VDERGLDTFKARVYLNFWTGLSHFPQHVRFGRALPLRASEEATKIGDLPYIGYCRAHFITDRMFSGEPLCEARREAMDALDFARKTRAGFLGLSYLVTFA